ncbi:MAG TPA: nitroreductase family protein [Dehalococcoidia bacterium]|nr:nitroreductase family protein [Dehalococcoidia bacterium]
MDEAPLYETMRTAGSRRRFTPEPVSDEQVRALIEAAICAPNARNGQIWSFIAVREAETRAQIAAIYRQAWYDSMTAALQTPAGSEEEARDRRSWRYLADHMAEAPLLIFACLRGPAPSEPPRAAYYYGSIFPAVQNLILAARGMGLGTTLTTVHKNREPQVREVLGVPESIDLVALIPVGRPVNPFTPVRRRPAAEFLHLEHW